MSEKRKCLECGDPVTGRSDKKFCSDSCRNAYNNRLNRDEINFMRKINRILRKNRLILSRLNPHGKAKVSYRELMDEDFNFNYYTNVYKTKAGKTYYFVYEQGYLELDDDKFALVKRENYVR